MSYCKCLSKLLNPSKVYNDDDDINTNDDDNTNIFQRNSNVLCVTTIHNTTIYNIIIKTFYPILNT